jgi:hypothetical protein
MKEPYFDAQHTDIDLTMGYWASGHSYSNPDLTIDTGGPLTDKLAYRVSYLSRYGEGYYLNDHNQTQDIYAALTWLADPKLKVEAWVQVYEDRTNEIAGVNRVTEDFIKNGNYIAGPAARRPRGPTPTTATTSSRSRTRRRSPSAARPTAPTRSSTRRPPTRSSSRNYDALINPSDTARRSSSRPRSRRR